MTTVTAPALLALGELEREDRDWILARLGDAERERLEHALALASGAGGGEGGGGGDEKGDEKGDYRDDYRDGYRDDDRGDDRSDDRGHYRGGDEGGGEDGAWPPDGSAPGMVASAAATAAQTPHDPGAAPVAQTQVGPGAAGGNDDARWGRRAASAPAAAARLTPRQRLVSAQAREIHALLAAEPDWMVAVVCGLHRWPWLPEFLRLLGHDRAERVMALARACPEPAPGVVRALVDLLGTRLRSVGLRAAGDAHAHRDGAAHRGAASHGFLRRVRAWMR